MIKRIITCFIITLGLTSCLPNPNPQTAAEQARAMDPDSFNGMDDTTIDRMGNQVCNLAKRSADADAFVDGLLAGPDLEVAILTSRPLLASYCPEEMDRLF